MGWMRVEIEISVLRENLETVRKLLSPNTAIAAVVKSEAYGHGMVETARAFAEAGVEMLAVSLPHEGVELRETGFDQPILLLGGLFPEEAETVVAYDLSPVVSSVDVLKALSKAAFRLEKPVKVHLKVDTGMGRRGCAEEELRQILGWIVSHPELELEGLLSHLSVADVNHTEARDYTEGQLRRFGSVTGCVKKASFHPRWTHIANSAAIAWYPQSHHTLVRPGIVLYGGLEGFNGTREAMRVSSRLIEIREVEEGACLSYGRTFVAPRRMRIGIVPVGYATGYLRTLSNKGEMIVSGKRVPIIGTVCMDLTLLDLSEVPRAELGDEVVLLGRQGGSRISVFELAEWMNTITYEVFCLLGNSPFAEKLYHH